MFFRRVLAPFIVILVVLAIVAAIIFFIIRGGGVVHTLQSGQDIVSLILTLLQLLGIFLLVVILLYVLVQYIQYTRSHRFIFDGFSNAEKLIGAANMPIELTMLAREKLVYQVKVLYSQWRRFARDEKPDARAQSHHEKPDAEALLTDELYFGQAPFEQNLTRYVSSEMTRDDEAAEYLRKVIKTLMDSEGINLMDLAGEIAPKEVTPIMKFIEAVVPPRAVRATGHLQWWSETAKGAGITFEFVDLGSRRNLMVRTIWYRSKPEQESQKQAPLSGDDEKTLAVEHYIKLLDPTMRWLALMFWEERMKARTTSLVKYFFDVRGKKRRAAQLLYLFGSLYNASAEQFSAYEVFFRQLAIEHLRQATMRDKSWYLPYLYLGNLYSLKVRDTKGEMHEKMLNEALKLFGNALEATKIANESRAVQQRITLDQALAELFSASGNEEYTREIYHTKIVGIEEEVESDSFDFEQRDCARLLYNLAIWYGFTRAIGVRIPVNAREKAWRYLAYSLTLSEYLQEGVELVEPFHDLFLGVMFKSLKEELAKHKNLTAKEERTKAKMTGVAFKAEINEILKRVDEEIEQSGR